MLFVGALDLPEMDGDSGDSGDSQPSGESQKGVDSSGAAHVTDESGDYGKTYNVSDEEADQGEGPLYYPD